MQQWWLNNVVTKLLSWLNNIVDNVVHAAWPAQLCPYHAGQLKVVHARQLIFVHMHADVDQINLVHACWRVHFMLELILYVRQMKEITYISRCGNKELK